MKTFKRTPVYSSLPTRSRAGKTNLAIFRKQRGVYKIYENGKLIYIGSSLSNLYSTILRHFQGWRDNRQPSRISYKSKLKSKTYKVEVTVTKGKRETQDLEEMLIAKHQPRDNKDNNYNFYNPKYEKGRFATCFDCYENSTKEKVKAPTADDGYSFNSSGELVAPDGTVLF